MRRYYREQNGDLYDRKIGRYITVKTERRIGDHYYINDGADQIVIHVDDVEEIR